MKTFEEAVAVAGDSVWTTSLMDLHYCHERLGETHHGVPEEAARWYRALAREAHALLAERGSAIQMPQVGELVSAKQADYGPQNILKYGHVGLHIRLWDKIARYENLIGAGTPKHESVEDTLMDIIGYCLIGLMLLEGTFELPLAADEPNVLPFSPRVAQEVQLLEETYGKTSNKGWDVT